MSIYRAQIALQLDTEFPRDALTLNPHYDGTNPQAIANALKTKLLAHSNIGAVQPFTIKIYDAEKAPPSYPLATANNVATARPSGAPRELALCLSYYSGFNRPRLRGRLFIPGTLLGGTAQTRPSLAQQNAAMAWQDVFNIGSNTAIWVVWSPTGKAASVVTNVWVDDEWDTIRSRGLDPTSRVSATVTQQLEVAVPWPTYSERFVATSAHSTWFTFIVPSHKRAVVKCFTMVNNTTSEFLFIVRVAGFLVANRVIPASTGTQVGDLSIVAYTGEDISVFTYSPNGAVTVSGYLLDDISGRSGPPAAPALQPEWPPPDPTVIEPQAR